MAFSLSHASGRLMFEKSSFLNEKTKHDCIIRNKCFNHQVDICLAGCTSLPPDISVAMKRNAYWLVKNLKPDILIRKEFIEAFIKRGSLTLLSQDTCIDQHDCIALTDKGILQLNLTKDTYQHLGLQGVPSSFNKSNIHKYVVNIDLTAESFLPGKKCWERVRWCLTDRLNLNMNYLFLWQPIDAEICSSSLAVYFTNNGSQVFECSPDRQITHFNGVRSPKLNSEEVRESTNNAGYVNMWQWLGAMKLNIEEGASDDFVSTLCCAEPAVELAACTSCQLTGFISSQQVHAVCLAVREEMKQNAELSWAALTVHGFQDSPTRRAEHEHGFLNSGDNIYTFIIFPNDSYWLYTATSTNDVLS